MFISRLHNHQQHIQIVSANLEEQADDSRQNQTRYPVVVVQLSSKNVLPQYRSSNCFCDNSGICKERKRSAEYVDWPEHEEDSRWSGAFCENLWVWRIRLHNPAIWKEACSTREVVIVVCFELISNDEEGKSLEAFKE